MISVNCILSVEHINQGSNIENVSIYNMDGFGIDWDLVTDYEIQCLAAYEEDFRTTIQNNEALICIIVLIAEVLLKL